MSVAVLERPRTWQPTRADPLGVAALDARIRRNDLLRTEGKGGRTVWHESTEKLGSYMRGRLRWAIATMDERYEAPPDCEKDEGTLIFGGLTCVWTIRELKGTLTMEVGVLE